MARVVREPFRCRGLRSTRRRGRCDTMPVKAIRTDAELKSHWRQRPWSFFEVEMRSGTEEKIAYPLPMWRQQGIDGIVHPSRRRRRSCEAGRVGDSLASTLHGNP